MDKLKEKGAYDQYAPDIVLYDVLGDVVCGGFSMPMRGGYADKVFIITSGENMAIHAAANIAVALDNFKGRGYASLGGIILNRRNVKDEEAKVKLKMQVSKQRIFGMVVIGVLLFALIFSALSASAEKAKLQRVGNSQQLYVDGRPFIVLGGERVQNQISLFNQFFFHFFNE